MNQSTEVDPNFIHRCFLISFDVMRISLLPISVFLREAVRQVLPSWKQDSWSRLPSYLLEIPLERTSIPRSLRRSSDVEIHHTALAHVLIP